MTELAQWAGFQFYIAADSALLFDKLKMSTEMETEEQEDQGQKYVASKAGKPVEISLNVILNASLGVDVQQACMAFLDAAKTGQHGYFYMAGQRLLPFEIMMTKASTDEIKMAPGGRWIAANISCTFVQSENGTILGGVIARQEASAGGGGGGGSGGGGSGGGFLKPLADAIKNDTLDEYVSLGSAWMENHSSGTTGSGQTNTNQVTINARTVAGSIATAAKPASSGVTQSSAADKVKTAVSAVGNAATNLFSGLASSLQNLTKKIK